MGRGQRDGQRQPPVPRKRARPSWNQQDADDFAPFASWDGDDFSRIYGDHDDEPDDSRRATVVVPAITLPSFPSAHRPTHAAFDDDYEPDTDTVRDGYRDEYHAVPQKPRKHRDDKRMAPPDASDPSRRKLAVAPANKMAVAKKPKVPAEAKVVLVPGTEPPQQGVRFRARRIGSRLIGPLHVVRSHRKALTVFALALMLMGVVANTTGLLSDAGLLSRNSWNALASFGGPPPTPTPIPAPDSTSASHYVQKYGFDYPSNPQSIGSAEWNRLTYMLPYAYRATAAYDRRYHASIEPEMLVWWTHSEGIRGRINYSNCANNPPLAGYNYFNNIQNCPHASFWQLGFGNQFSVIYVLRNAFSDLYGNPNDPQLVQKVGQWVLNYDRSQGTVPACGGYSCTFPARTIDSIMSGIDTSLGVQTQDNWWASVLSRDPAINCYMIAHALTYFNHAATRNWIGCYYYEPCWGYESNKLGDILAAWSGLRRAAHL